MNQFKEIKNTFITIKYFYSWIKNIYLDLKEKHKINYVLYIINS